MRHAVVVVGAAWVGAGLLVHALDTQRRPATPSGPLRRRLGAVEALTVLGTLDALLLLFVVVQVRYLFGGRAVLESTGLTYAEYARRGFAELVAVAALGLLLLLVLAGITRRQAPHQRGAFAVAAALLTGLMLVVLMSAFQRLLLYEQAFGFTRVRAAVHVAMLWLAVLLIAVAVLEVRNRLDRFPLVALAAVVGFALTLNILGVDRLIASANVQRAVHGLELDTSYLLGLSADAVPNLADAWSSAPDPVAIEVGAALACQAVRLHGARPILEWHVSRARARDVLADLADELSVYALVPVTSSVIQIEHAGRSWTCIGAAPLPGG